VTQQLAARYTAPSQLTHGLNSSFMSLATNTLREAVFFRGQMVGTPALREGFAALRAVVVSDLRPPQKERTAFKAWLARENQRFLDQAGARSEAAIQKIQDIEKRREALLQVRELARKPFYQARAKYYQFAIKHYYERFLLLDPVTTVHPDEISFEAFSRDESSYARLALPYTSFRAVDDFACGTTNIDFSAALYEELERLRSYRPTQLEVGSKGVTLALAGREVHHEKVIPLPKGWLRGFLQVHSIMSMGLLQLPLRSVDLFNIAQVLSTRRARKSPRALRYELIPGQQAQVVIEPFEIKIPLTAVFEGQEARTVRVWGRDRLMLLQRCFAVAKEGRLHLAGTGLPSIITLELGGPSLTLALSGWTDQDWSAGPSFEKLSRPSQLSPKALLSVYEALLRRRRSGEAALAAELSMTQDDVRSALSLLCQAGRAMLDLRADCFRHRDLFAGALTEQEAKRLLEPPLESLSAEERAARSIVQAGHVRIIARRPVAGNLKLSGSVKGLDGEVRRPQLTLDPEAKIAAADCTCAKAHKHGLTQGPCEHMLALRQAHLDLDARRNDSA
jgi:hypothetical protein